jgi:hypothetical protein
VETKRNSNEWSRNRVNETEQNVSFFTLGSGESLYTGDFGSIKRHWIISIGDHEAIWLALGGPHWLGKETDLCEYIIQRSAVTWLSALSSTECACWLSKREYAPM